MTARVVAALVRAGFALLTLTAIVVQIAGLIAAGTFNAANYFSYFTIQSNLIAAAALLLAAAAWRRERPVALELLRGAATVYLAITFVVFAVLLGGTDVDTPTPWVNTVLHRVVPIVVMLDWVFAPPSVGIGFRRSLVWLAYPIAWTLYTMARGLAIAWYPYPFVDPTRGFVLVVADLAAILAFGVALCGLVSAVSRWRQEPRSSQVAARA